MRNFNLAPIADRIILQDVEEYLKENKNATVDDLEKYCIMLGKGTTRINEENIEITFQRPSRIFKSRASTSRCRKTVYKYGSIKDQYQPYPEKKLFI